MDIKNIVKKLRDRLTRRKKSRTVVHLTTEQCDCIWESINTPQPETDMAQVPELLLAETDEQPAIRAEDIYSELMASVEDRPLQSCNNCKYHNPLMCAVNPLRTSSHIFANDCKDWEAINR